MTGSVSHRYQPVKASPLSPSATSSTADRPSDGAAPGLAYHVAALHEAGFTELGTVWQDLNDSIVMAIR